MGLKIVTLTGADDSVSPEDLFKLSAEFPFVEWGILMVDGPISKGISRYPSEGWKLELLSQAPVGVNLCAHYCGFEVFEALIYNDPKIITRLSMSYQRVQLNTHGTDLLRLVPRGGPSKFAGLTKKIIFQCDGVNDPNVRKWCDFGLGSPLFDTSSGAGVLPEEGWPLAWPKIYCGYAGGLGPENVVEELKWITEASRGQDFWIDMETRIRSKKDRVFDLDKCRAVLEAVAPFVDKPTS